MRIVLHIIPLSNKTQVEAIIASEKLVMSRRVSAVYEMYCLLALSPCSLVGDGRCSICYSPFFKRNNELLVFASVDNLLVKRFFDDFVDFTGLLKLNLLRTLRVEEAKLLRNEQFEHGKADFTPGTEIGIEIGFGFFLRFFLNKKGIKQPPKDKFVAK